MDYRVVFDATQTSPDWRGAAFGLIFVGIGLFLWFYRHNALSRFGIPRVNTLFAKMFLGFAVVWTLMATIGQFTSHREAVSAVRDGRTRVVEGLVENFDPMPVEGHKDESFTVGDVRFAYSDYKLVSGFHNSASHGGPIREGLPVRIQYSGPRSAAMILKLEITAR